MTITQTSYEPKIIAAPSGFADTIGGSEPPSSEPLKANAVQEEQVYSFQFVNNWQLDENQSLQFGGEYRRADQDGVRVSTNFD